jgi:hypothetical protein
LVDEHTSSLPLRSPVSRMAGWMSVMHGPGVCDEKKWSGRKRLARKVAESLEQAFQVSRSVENPQDQHIAVLDAVENEVFGEP